MRTKQFPRRPTVDPTWRALIPVLMVKTGLSYDGVRKILFENRTPENVVLAAVWNQTVAEFKKGKTHVK